MRKEIMVTEPEEAENWSKQQILLEIQDQQHSIGERPPHIDSSDLEGEFPGELKMNIVLNNDFVLIPEAAWENLYQWYGGGPIFKRKTFRHHQKDTEIIELYPPLIFGYQLRKNCSIDYSSRQSLFVR